MESASGAPQAAALPRIILLFLGVDWPLYMRRPAVLALAQAAAKYGSVVVAVNRPLCPFSTPFRKPARVRELAGRARLEKLSPNLYLFSPRYFLHDRLAGRMPALQRLNLGALRASYRGLQRRLDIMEPRPLVWFNYPEQGYVAELFPGSFILYELYDLLPDAGGSDPPRVTRRDERLRSQVDLLLTTSQALQGRYGSRYRRACFYGNGLSRAVFTRLAAGAPPARALQELPSPRLGYAGMVDRRIDWELITALARLEPEWQFLFVGPVRDPEIETRCRPFGNIHFSAAVTPDEIPSVLASFDLGLLPYHDMEFFRFSNPLKFYEMAAAGLPMVASPIDELRRFPGELVTVVNGDAKAWREAIQAGLARNRDQVAQAGRRIAGEFIWEEMAARLLEMIAGMRQAPGG